MIHLGLSSHLLSGASPEEVTHLAAVSGLRGIEWHVSHVPTGNVALAHEIRDLSLDWGLPIIAYDSEWRAGEGTFATVLNTALLLNAKSVRILVGDAGFADTGSERRRVLCDEVRSACELARRAGVAVSVGAGRGTLADTHEGRLWLMRQVAHSNFRLDWSFHCETPSETVRSELSQVRQCLGNLHLPVEADVRAWLESLRLIVKGRRFALLRCTRHDAALIRKVATCAQPQPFPLASRFSRSSS